MIRIILVLIIIFIYFNSHSVSIDGFANKSEKAQSIFEWFKNAGLRATYENYKAQFASDSNIVEYEDVKRLFLNKNLTLDSVQQYI